MSALKASSAACEESAISKRATSRPAGLGLGQQRGGVVELAALAEQPFAQPPQVAQARLPALLAGRLDRDARRVGARDGILRPDPGIARHRGLTGYVEPVRHQVCEAVGAGADRSLLVPVPLAEAPRQAAHHQDQLELALELPEQAAQKRFGTPRPRAGGIGVVANLYWH